MPRPGSGPCSDDRLPRLAYGKVRLISSDPRWPEAFQRLAVRLRAALGELAVAVEHVGATAGPGLPAKPILDVAVGLLPASTRIGPSPPSNHWASSFGRM